MGMYIPPGLWPTGGIEVAVCPHLFFFPTPASILCPALLPASPCQPLNPIGRGLPLPISLPVGPDRPGVRSPDVPFWGPFSSTFRPKMSKSEPRLIEGFRPASLRLPSCSFGVPPGGSTPANPYLTLVLPLSCPCPGPPDTHLGAQNGPQK